MRICLIALRITRRMVMEYIGDRYEGMWRDGKKDGYYFKEGNKKEEV